MHFTQFLQKSAKEIDNEIDIFFATWNKDVEQISPQLVPLVTALGESAAGGKRIRGALVLLGYQLASNAENKHLDLLKIAVAYEIFQTAILAHDDIIDKSPIRRGKPALHMQLGGDHYGMSQTICLGDIGFFLAFRIIAESSFAEQEKNKAIVFFSKAIHDTVLGEMLDVAFSKPDIKVSEKDVQDVSLLKTAYYTFVGPLTLGAVLGGADDRQLDALKIYGENIGIAFQIQDDIKDIFGTIVSLKKEVGGDIKEGKHTVLFIKAMEQADEVQRAVLKKYYGKGAIGSEAIEAVKNIFVETHALAYAESLVSLFSEKAQSIIPEITQNKEMRNILKEIVMFVIKKENHA